MATIRSELSVNPTGTDYLLLDTNQYPGATFYFEADVQFGGSSASLRRKGTTTDDASLGPTGSGSGFTRLRSAAFTPPTGQTEYFCNNSGIRAARVIAVSSDASVMESQFSIGLYQASIIATTITPQTPAKLWNYTAANWDGTVTCYAEVVWSGDTSGMGYTVTIRLQEDDGSFGSWADKVTIVNAGTGTAVTRTRVSFTPTTGRNYRIAALVSSNMATGVTITNARIVVQQSASPTKAEKYYSISEVNQTVTGSRDADFLFDPAEWSGVTNTYYHEFSASASSTAKLQYDILGTPTDITGSSATGSNRVRSSALTMPGASTECDANITANGGNVAGHKMVVVMSINATPADILTPIRVLHTQNNNTLLRM